MNPYQKLCPHLVMCASSIISKQMGLKLFWQKNHVKHLDINISKSTVWSGNLKAQFEIIPGKKLTRQNRCFYLHKNSRGRCIRVPGEGISFCCLRTQRVCWGKQSRPGTTVQWPERAQTSPPLRLRAESGRAQHFQNCSHCLLRRCSHCRCCYCWCWVLNSRHHRRLVVASDCLTWCNKKLIQKLAALQSIQSAAYSLLQICKLAGLLIMR